MKKNLIFFLMSTLIVLNSFAQKQVTGIVYDSENKSPLVGATIVLKGTTIGTICDFDGKFQLEAPSENTIIQVSFIGYNSKEVIYTGQSTLEIGLVSSVSAIDEVVVVGYGTQKKSDLTGSVGSIEGDDITKITSTNLGQAMQGRMAGVQITQPTGKPGEGISVQIRGEGSILSGNEPLVLVNGFQGSLDDIDPDNVESITVLKDAAAASIYGSRAANGVVLVTTKKGKAGQTKVTFKSEVGVQSITQSPDYLNASEWASRQNEGRSNRGETPFWNSSNILPENITESTDWKDFVFRNAPIQNYHLGITGGSEKTKYALGVGYVNQEGTIIGTKFDRINIRLDLEHKLGERITIGTNLSTFRSSYASAFNIYDNAGRGVLNLIPGAPATLPPYDALGQPTYPRYSGEQFCIERFISPALASDITDYTKKVNSVTANVFLEAELLEGLKYKLGLNGSFNNSNERDFTKFFELFSVDDPSMAVLTSDPALLTLTGTQQEFWEVQNILTYNKTFGDHNLSLLAGISAQRNTLNMATSSGSGFPSNDIQSLSAAENVLSIGSESSTLSLASQFARINYSYKGKYLLQGNIRRDGTSVFAPGNHYGTFPSFSAGWRLSEENFLKDNKYISNLKIRYGYGSLGNAQITPFAWISTFTVDQFYVMGAGQSLVPAYSIKDLANPDVKWETTTSSDFGLDFSLFKGKLSFVGDIYSKTTSDMLLRIPITLSSGYENGPVANLGEIKNTGWEALLSYNNTIGDFKLGASFNISRNQNEVVDLGNTEAYTDYAVRVQEGLPLFSYWGFQTDGIWQSYDEIAANPSQSGALPGSLRYKDINGYDENGKLTGVPDGVIDDADKTYIGSNMPDYVYGFNLNAEYKNFDLSVLFQGEANKDIAIAPEFGGLGGSLGGTVNDNVDRYYYENRTILGEDGNVSIPGSLPAIGLVPQTGEWSDYNIKNISYLRIKNIQLGYSLSKNTVERLGIGSLRVYMNLNNPVLWTDYIGYDPEFKGSMNNGKASSDTSNTGLTSMGGLDYYPQSKSIVFGINVSF